MFIAEMFIKESGPRIVVTYPGRFQPFHRGHAAVFQQLQAKFGRDAVYILTSNKTDGAKSPFNFSDKIQLMTAAGVPQDRVVETSNVYALPDSIDKTNTIFITAVGAPDADRLQPDAVYKRDNPAKSIRAGDETYFKTWKNIKEATTADQHGYVIIVPEVKASLVIGGKTYDASHGTDCRNLWNMVRDDPTARLEYIKQLYGRADPEIGLILDKIPKAVAESHEHSNTKVDLLVRRARVMYPIAKTDDQALAMYVLDKEERDVDHVEQEEHSTEEKLERVAQQIKQLSKLIKDLSVNEAAGVGVVASNAKMARDPRYSMSLTRDVHPDTPMKNARAFRLVETLGKLQHQLKQLRAQHGS
jgi:hypothetical protein